ncbi:MAG TPA: 50S ribosomal protein L25 [Bryobacteraceae bacterium]|nr:50S ribosomal protein L25 [Bryobacteraceae bacterium]
MRKNITVSVELRESRGKNEARRLRAGGLVPAVVYGSGQQTLVVSVDPKTILRILHSSTGHNTIFEVSVKGGETTPAMIVDWQFDPVQENLLHLDLKRIDLSKRLRVSVPVHTQGDAKGVKQQGGLLELVAREIEIECLPDDIPEHFTVDVTELMMGDAKRAGDIALSGTMKLVSPTDAVVAHVVALRAEAEPEAAAPAEGEAAAAAEPEVIKKGKKEEEGAEAEDKEKGKKK